LLASRSMESTDLLARSSLLFRVGIEWMRMRTWIVAKAIVCLL